MNVAKATTRSELKRLASAWCLSILFHVAAAAGLALMSITIELGATQAAPITDLGAVSLTLDAREERESAKIPADELKPTPEFVVEDWRDVFSEEKIEVEKPVTEFSDDATFPAQQVVFARLDNTSNSLAAELNVAFTPKPRKPVAPAVQKTEVASVLPVTGTGGGGGGNGGSGTVGLGGSPGEGGGSGGGIGTGRGTGTGSGVGSGTGGGIGNASVGPEKIAARAGSASGAGAKPPRAKQMERGTYPSDARRNGQEGTVTLLVEVLTNGKTGSVEIAGSSGFAALDRAAREAAQNWRFYPAEISGQAVVAQIRVPYVFRLVDAR